MRRIDSCLENYFSFWGQDSYKAGDFYTNKMAIKSRVALLTEPLGDDGPRAGIQQYDPEMQSCYSPPVSYLLSEACTDVSVITNVCPVSLSPGLRGFDFTPE